MTKEHSIRETLQARLCRSLLPATLGLAMFVSGCATGRAVVPPDLRPAQTGAAEEPVGDFDLRGDMDAQDDSVPPPEPLEFDVGSKM